jgi:hypothetical protein
MYIWIYLIEDFFLLILDLDSNNEEEEEDDDDDDDDDSTPIPQISNDSQLSEDSIENLRLQKAG